jgi:flagellar hook-length control protein FliK
VTAPAAAAPAAPATPAPPLAAQLAPPIVRLREAAPGEHVLTVAVTPENLGPVQVRAHVGPEGVRVELVAPTDEARRALAAMLPDLRRDLAQGALGTSVQIAPASASAQSGQTGTSTNGQSAFGAPQNGVGAGAGQAGQQGSGAPGAGDSGAGSGSRQGSAGSPPSRLDAAALDGAAPASLRLPTTTTGLDVLA